MDAQLLAHARRVARLTSWRLHLVIPSILAAGEAFDLRLSCTAADGLPVEDFDHELVFDDCQGVEGLPPSLRPAPDGSAMLSGLRATGPGVARVRARVTGTGRVGGDPVVASNPAWVEDEPRERLFWGDLHVHTVFSNCHADFCRDPRFCYEYARDVSFLDFCAAADHLRGIMSEDGRWQRLQELVRAHDAPGRFLPLLAFESSHAKGYGGDNNVYFRDAAAPVFWLDRDDMRGNAPKVHLRRLWEFLDATGQEYMTVPHHTARQAKNRTFDEDYYDPARESLFEVYSGWGSSERPEPNRLPLAGGNSSERAYFVHALLSGCRYGAIASSDDHATLPGSEHNHRGRPMGLHALAGWPHKGLVAVRCPELTRASLWPALRSRRCYATTLARSLLQVRLSGMGPCMGAELALADGRELAGCRRFEVDLTCHGAGGREARVCLVRNGETVATAQVRAPALYQERSRVLLEDACPLERVAVRGARFHPDPFACYYVRVQGPDGFTQWTSPVWIDL